MLTSYHIVAFLYATIECPTQIQNVFHSTYPNHPPGNYARCNTSRYHDVQTPAPNNGPMQHCASRHTLLLENEYRKFLAWSLAHRHYDHDSRFSCIHIPRNNCAWTPIRRDWDFLRNLGSYTCVQRRVWILNASRCCARHNHLPDMCGAYSIDSTHW